MVNCKRTVEIRLNFPKLQKSTEGNTIKDYNTTQIKIMDRNINSKETRLLQSQIHSDTEA